MIGTVRLSFSTREGEGQPVARLYNPGDLPAAVRDQAGRFGLIASKDLGLSGSLKGSRSNLIEMIKTYGYEVEVVPHVLQRFGVLMRLSGRRPGNLTCFIDTADNEVLLRVQTDMQGRPLIGFTLYDASGQLVAQAPDLKAYPEGLAVRSGDEVLLATADDDVLAYRLYNHKGTLITESDGAHTRIYALLRMEGSKAVASWRKAKETLEDS